VFVWYVVRFTSVSSVYLWSKWVCVLMRTGAVHSCLVGWVRYYY